MNQRHTSQQAKAVTTAATSHAKLVAEALEKPWWAPIAHFAAHTVVGTAIFIIIGLPAVGLSLAIEWLEGIHVPAFPLAVLHFVEQALCVIDAGLFLVYIVLTSYHALKEFWQ